MLERFLNPVLVREMRQALRNRFVMVLMQVYLVLLLLPCMFAAMEHGSDPTGMGMTFFRIYLYVAFGATATVTVLHTACRLVAERINEDMMYVSTLKPGRIARGKFWSGFVLSFLFYSMTLPFMTLAYMLRGIDLSVMLLGVFFTFMLVQMLNAMTVAFLAGTTSFLGAIPRVLALLLVGGLALFFPWYFLEDVIFDSPSYMSSWDFIVLFSLISGFFFVVVPVAMLTIAACQFTPATANRMLPLRILMTVFALLTLILILVVLSFMSMPASGLEAYAMLWVILGMYPVAFCAFLGMGERCEYGLRLRSRIPKGDTTRILAFPFFTGDVNAFIWLLPWFFVSLVFFFLALASGNRFGSHHMGVYLVSPVLVFNYCVTATLLWHAGLKRLLPKSSTWVIFLVLLTVGIFASLGMARWSGNSLDDALVFVPNPFWIWEPYSADGNGFFLQAVFAGMWFMILLPILVIWGVKRLVDFVPYIPVDKPEYAQEQHAQEPGI